MTRARHRPRANNAGGDEVFAPGPHGRSATKQPKTGGELKRCSAPPCPWCAATSPVDLVRLTRENRSVQ